MRAKAGLAIGLIVLVILGVLHESGAGSRGATGAGRPAGTILIRVIAPALF